MAKYSGYLFWALILITVLIAVSGILQDQAQSQDRTYDQVYLHWTITRHNGRITEVHLDEIALDFLSKTVLGSFACDGADELNENGHTCILLADDQLSLFSRVTGIW